MRNRLAALIQEGVLDAPSSGAPSPTHPRAGAEAGGFAGIPGLKLLAEVPLLEGNLRPHLARRASVAPPAPPTDLPTYALDPRPEGTAALDARLHRLERASLVCRVRYWCAVAVSLSATVTLGLILLS